MVQYTAILLSGHIHTIGIHIILYLYSYEHQIQQGVHMAPVANTDTYWIRIWNMNTYSKVETSGIPVSEYSAWTHVNTEYV